MFVPAAVFSATLRVAVSPAVKVGGAFASWIVPKTSALPAAMLAIEPVGLLSCSLNVSSDSSAVSSAVWTLIVLTVSPAANVSVPELAV